MQHDAVDDKGQRPVKRRRSRIYGEEGPDVQYKDWKMKVYIARAYYNVYIDDRGHQRYKARELVFFICDHFRPGRAYYYTRKMEENSKRRAKQREPAVLAAAFSTYVVPKLIEDTVMQSDRTTPPTKYANIREKFNLGRPT